jgi:hypothetical protein
MAGPDPDVLTCGRDDVGVQSPHGSPRGPSFFGHDMPDSTPVGSKF